MINTIRQSTWIFGFLLAMAVILVIPTETHARGKLVKGPLPAVYYVDTNDERWVFPNEKIYRSWYPDFSNVAEVSAEQLAEYPIGGVVYYRPGTRLVKIQSDPRVYTLEPGGVLRHIGSESVARTLYGDAWNTRVDDLPDGFFAQYVVGEPLTESVYPDGTVIEQNGSRYVVWNGKRELLTDEGFKNNAYQEVFVIPTSLLIEEGSSISAERTELADTAQVSLGANQELALQIEGVSLSGSVVQDDDNAPVMRLVLSVARPVTLEELAFEIRAKDNADKDADPGGLLRGDNNTSIEANLNRLRAMLRGKQILNSTSLLVSNSADDAQNLTLAGKVTLLPGRHTITLVMDVAELAPIEEDYTFSVLPGQWKVREGDVLVDSEALNGFSQSFQVRPDGIDISRIRTSDHKLIRGETEEVEFGAFRFENARSDTVTLKEIVLTGYVDEGEGDSDFVADSDDDGDGVSTSVGDVIARLRVLNDKTDEVLADVTNISPDGRVRLFDLVLLGGEELDLAILVTPDASAPTQLGADRVAFDFAEIDEMEARNAQNMEIDFVNPAPNGGASPSTFMVISEQGNLTVGGAGAAPARFIMGTSGNTVYNFDFEATEEEDIIVETLSLRLTDVPSKRSVGLLTLHYTDTAGQSRTATANVQNNGTVTFANLDLRVPADDDVDPRVTIKVNSKSEGAISGDTIGFDFEPGTFRARGARSGFIFDDDEFGDTLTDSTGASPAATVRRSQPLVQYKSAPTQRGSQTIDAEIFTFDMWYQGDGAPDITKMTFKIEPTDNDWDEDQEQDDNELLEFLADLNGDGAQDDEVFELRDADNDLLGEGSAGTAHFSIFDDSEGAIDTTPAGLEVEGDDYGLLAIEFRSGNEPTLVNEQGDESEFTFFMDTRGFAPGGWTVKVTLLGGDDFAWNDGGPAAPTLDGSDVGNLPVTSPNVPF